MRRPYSLLIAVSLAVAGGANNARAAVVDLPGLGPFEIAYDATNPVEQGNPNADFRGADGVDVAVFPEAVSNIFYQDLTPNLDDAGYLRTTESPSGGGIGFHFRPTDGLFEGTFRITTRADLNDPARVFGEVFTGNFPGTSILFFDTDTDNQGDPDESGKFIDTVELSLPDVTTDLRIIYRIINPEGGAGGDNGVQLFRSDNQEDSFLVVSGTIVIPEPAALAPIVLAGLLLHRY